METASPPRAESCGGLAKVESGRWIASRRGADVVDVRSADSSTIVLTARLEVLPGAVRLHVVGLRGAERALLGTISTRASGSSRAAQLRAVVKQVCLEASRFE
ncbi:MAG: hypothetical protein IT380_29105 [Myxococcales bacterium]|nr:hypothetical protein [Myxococcales bacterium]